MSNQKIEDVIKEKGKFIGVPVGDSMMPLLRNRRDTVLLAPPPDRLKRHDIPLYKRSTGKYVLHRVVKVKREEYYCCGDNRILIEKGVTSDMIVGIVKGIYRNDKFIDVNSFFYNLYKYVWYYLFPIRFVYIKFRNKLNRKK